MSSSASQITTHAEPSSATPARRGLVDAVALQRQGIKRFWLTLPIFGAALALLLVSMALGHADLVPVCWVLAYTVVGMAGIYVLLNSRIALRSRDPMQIYPQLLFGVGLVALCYALVPSARSAALQWLCLIIVFDMRRLPKKQIYSAALLAMLLPTLAMTASWFLQGSGSVQLTDELIKLALSSVLVPALLMVSTFGRSLRVLQIKTKEDLVAALHQQQQLAMRDGLTGLYNRRHMTSLLDEEVQRLHRSKRPFCVAILDLDFFKRVNDQHGHAMGDLVLQQFAALGLQVFGGRTDSLARWGGEEFLVLMPETTEAQAHEMLSQLRGLVHSHDWSRYQAGLAVTFSAGICEHVGEHNLDRTLELADQALYNAKAQGRDRIEPTPQAGTAPGSPLHSATSKSTISPPAPQPTFMADLTKSTPSTSAAKPRRERHAKPLGVIGKVFLGTDERMHARLRQCLLVSGIYTTAIMFILFFLIPGGFISRPNGIALAIADSLPAFIPYLLVRSGLTAKWADPGIVLPQIIWACVQLAISYVVAPASRPYDLQVLCVCLVFGFASLRAREAVAAGIIAIALLLTAFTTLAITRPADFKLSLEMMEVLSTTVVLSLLTWQSRNFSLARARQKQERLTLTNTMAHVAQMMTHDVLTGMFNRQHMETLLERESERQLRSGHSFAVALIDLDHFKRVNDEHGHHVGDEALTAFAKNAPKVLRETDIIGRWGGEEFLVILTDIDSGPQALQSVERLRKNVEQQVLCASAPSLQVTFSAGLAVYRVGEPLTALLERADQALYSAKAGGRNLCVLSDESAPRQTISETSERTGLSMEANDLQVFDDRALVRS